MSGLGYSNAKSVRISHIELSETKSKNPKSHFYILGTLQPNVLPLLGSTYFCTRGSMNDNPNLVPAC